jgi:hypothetical protein
MNIIRGNPVPMYYISSIKANQGIIETPSLISIMSRVLGWRRFMRLRVLQRSFIKNC